MHVDRALAGFLGYLLAGTVALFALAMTVIVGWRNWFGLQKKPKIEHEKSSPARGGRVRSDSVRTEAPKKN